jgi:hypothetical protein
VEPERFDDVASRVLEGPEPPQQPPRRRRWMLVLAASAALTGGLAAGASALTSDGGEGDRATTPPKRTNLSYTKSGVPLARDGRDCEIGRAFGGHGKRERRSADLRH